MDSQEPGRTLKIYYSEGEMAEGPRADRTENQLGTVEPSSRRTRGDAERRHGQAASPQAVLAAMMLAKWPCVVRGRQSSPDSAGARGGTGKAGENGQTSVAGQRRPYWKRPSVGYHPAGFRRHAPAAGSGGLIAIDWVTGRSHASDGGSGKSRRAGPFLPVSTHGRCLVPAIARDWDCAWAVNGVAQCTVRPQ